MSDTTNTAFRGSKLSFGIKEVDKSIIWPSLDPNFFMKPETQQCLEIIEALAEDEPQNVLLTGPQGCGKTEVAAWFAAKYERPMVMMNCAVIRENKDWFGYKTAKEGSVSWQRSDFVRALEKGNCAVLLDEFNRLHSTLHNSLYPLLDARRSTYVEELEEIVRVGPKTVFFATANIGFNHTGTFTMDAAIEDRFGLRVEVSFLNTDDEIRVLVSKTGIGEQDAKDLCKFASDIRRKATGNNASLSRAVSTRQLLQAAVLAKKMRDKSLPVKNALDYTVVPYFSRDGGAESEQSQVVQLIQGVFG